VTIYIYIVQHRCISVSFPLHLSISEDTAVHHSQQRALSANPDLHRRIRLQHHPLTDATGGGEKAAPMLPPAASRCPAALWNCTVPVYPLLTGAPLVAAGAV
jgi:hypothetical protein